MFYPGDWRKDVGVQSLCYHDKGVWFEMLCLMHESEERGKLKLNGRAMGDEQLARLLGLDNQTFNQTVTNLLTSGVTSREDGSGALLCRRMVRDENLRQIRRECGKKGGNPHLLNQRSKQIPTTGDKQKPTPSYSVSDSVSSSDNIPSGGEELQFPLHLNTPGFLKAWNEWLTYYKEKLGSKYRKKSARLTHQKQLDTLADLGTEARAVEEINRAIANNWQGFHPKDSTNPKTGNTKPDTKNYGDTWN